MAGKYILGVDVGTSSVKVLAAAVEDSRISVLGSGAVPSAGIFKGAVADPAALAAAIRESADCAAMAARVPVGPLHLGLGGRDLTAQNSLGSVALSGAVAAGDIERACRAAAIVAVPDDHRVLHVLPTGHWLDGRPEADPIGKTGGRLEVEAHIVSLPRPPLDELTRAITARGLTVAGLYANAVVLPAAVAGPQPSCLVVDLGAGLADIALVSGGKHVMTASVPLGGDYVTGDIAHGLGVSAVHGEEIKRYYAKLDPGLAGQGVILDCNDYGTTDKQIPYDFLATIVESRVEEIVALLHGYIEPALARYGADHILLTGGSSLLPSFSRWTEKVFGLPVRPTRPVLPEEYAHPANAACLGLIEYAVRQAPAGRESGPLRSFFKKLKEFI